MVIALVRLVGAKPYIQTNAWIFLIWHFGANFSEIWIEIHIFIQENAFENVVCKMAAILSRLTNRNHSKGQTVHIILEMWYSTSTDTVAQIW